jgi:hypothetical protein
MLCNIRFEHFLRNCYNKCGSHHWRIHGWTYSICINSTVVKVRLGEENLPDYYCTGLEDFPSSLRRPVLHIYLYSYLYRIPILVSIPIHTVYLDLYWYLYLYLYLYLTYTYVYLYLHEKEFNKLLVNFFELFASFPCTRNRNRIPNTVPVPVPKSPNEYGSDRFRLRNPGSL